MRKIPIIIATLVASFTVALAQGTIQPRTPAGAPPVFDGPGPDISGGASYSGYTFYGRYTDP